jgi:hypothetical protein
LERHDTLINCAELNSQWPVTESAQIQTTGLRQHGTKQTKTSNTNKNVSANIFKNQTNNNSNLIKNQSYHHEEKI